jgi:hypothetical protein
MAQFPTLSAQHHNLFVFSTFVSLIYAFLKAEKKKKKKCHVHHETSFIIHYTLPTLLAQPPMKYAFNYICDLWNLGFLSSQVETCEFSFFHPIQEPANHILPHTRAQIPQPEYS